MKYLKAIIIIMLLIINSIICSLPIFIFSIIKLCVPIRYVKTRISRVLEYFANLWVFINHMTTKIILPTKIHYTGRKKLDKKGSYLVICNHQNWLDIFILQKAFFNRIPFLKFFAKDNLKYIPLLGVCFWALDFPLMKRYSKEYLAKNPHKKGKDLEETIKACEKFKYLPISVVNFTEGSRFTYNKHKKQESPYKHLLKPKAGGTGMVLTTMGDKIKNIVDVTILYPTKEINLWQYLCGDIKDIYVDIRILDIDKSLVGNYIKDLEYKNNLMKYINNLWLEKDKKIEELEKKHL